MRIYQPEMITRLCKRTERARERERERERENDGKRETGKTLLRTTGALKLLAYFADTEIR